MINHLTLFSKSVINVGCADALLKLAEAVLGASGIDATDTGMRKKDKKRERHTHTHKHTHTHRDRVRHT